MDSNKKEYKEFLEKIDNTEFISNEELDNMDFYELAYYVQSLNQIEKTFESFSEEDK